MADRQGDVIRGTWQTGLTDADRAIAILVEPCQYLAETQSLGAGDDAQGSIERPASLPRPQQLIGDGPTHQVGDETDVAGLDRRTAGDRRRSEKHDPTGRLLGKALEKAIDHQPPEAVSDEMQTGRL